MMVHALPGLPSVPCPAIVPAALRRFFIASPTIILINKFLHNQPTDQLMMQSIDGRTVVFMGDVEHFPALRDPAVRRRGAVPSLCCAEEGEGEERR